MIRYLISLMVLVFSLAATAQVAEDDDIFVDSDLSNAFGCDEQECVNEAFDSAITSGPSGSGEANTGSNVGTGDGVFAGKDGVDLEHKSLKEGTGISIVSTALEILFTVMATYLDSGDTGTTDDMLYNGTVWYVDHDNSGSTTAGDTILGPGSTIRAYDFAGDGYDDGDIEAAFTFCDTRITGGGCTILLDAATYVGEVDLDLGPSPKVMGLRIIGQGAGGGNLSTTGPVFECGTVLQGSASNGTVLRIDSPRNGVEMSSFCIDANKVSDKGIHLPCNEGNCGQVTIRDITITNFTAADPSSIGVHLEPIVANMEFVTIDRLAIPHSSSGPDGYYAPNQGVYCSTPNQEGGATHPGCDQIEIWSSNLHADSCPDIFDEAASPQTDCSVSGASPCPDGLCDLDRSTAQPAYSIHTERSNLGVFSTFVGNNDLTQTPRSAGILFEGISSSGSEKFTFDNLTIEFGSQQQVILIGPDYDDDGFIGDKRGDCTATPGVPYACCTGLDAGDCDGDLYGSVTASALNAKGCVDDYDEAATPQTTGDPDQLCDVNRLPAPRCIEFKSGGSFDTQGTNCGSNASGKVVIDVVSPTSGKSLEWRGGHVVSSTMQEVNGANTFQRVISEPLCVNGFETTTYGGREPGGTALRCRATAWTDDEIIVDSTLVNAPAATDQEAVNEAFDQSFGNALVTHDGKITEKGLEHLTSLQTVPLQPHGIKMYLSETSGGDCPVGIDTNDGLTCDTALLTWTEVVKRIETWQIPEVHLILDTEGMTFLGNDLDMKLRVTSASDPWYTSFKISCIDPDFVDGCPVDATTDPSSTAIFHLSAGQGGSGWGDSRAIVVAENIRYICNPTGTGDRPFMIADDGTRAILLNFKSDGDDCDSSSSLEILRTAMDGQILCINCDIQTDGNKVASAQMGSQITFIGSGQTLSTGGTLSGQDTMEIKAQAITGLDGREASITIYGHRLENTGTSTSQTPVFIAGSNNVDSTSTFRAIRSLIYQDFGCDNWFSSGGPPQDTGAPDGFCDSDGTTPIATRTDAIDVRPYTTFTSPWGVELYQSTVIGFTDIIGFGNATTPSNTSHANNKMILLDNILRVDNSGTGRIINLFSTTYQTIFDEGTFVAEGNVVEEFSGTETSLFEIEDQVAPDLAGWETDYGTLSGPLQTQLARFFRSADNVAIDNDDQWNGNCDNTNFYYCVCYKGYNVTSGEECSVDTTLSDAVEYQTIPTGAAIHPNLIPGATDWIEEMYIEVNDIDVNFAGWR